MSTMTLRRTQLVCAGALILAGAHTALAQLGDPDQYGGYRSRGTVTVGGTFRDFTPAGQAGGHPDFGKIANTGVGRYVYIPADALDADNRPVFHAGGSRVRIPWRDAAARTIIPTKPYIAARPGDAAGTVNPNAGESVTSAASFAQWFRTIPGVSSAVPGSLSMTFNPASHSYIFDGTLDTFRGAGNPDYSYSFATEIPFVYEQGHDWWVAVRTSGDAFIFVDDQLVLDNGGGMGARPALAVEEGITVENSSIVGFSTDAGSAVSTNSGGAGAIHVQNSGTINGDALVGPGGDPASGIVCDRSNAITGDTGVLGSPIPITVVTMPTGMPASSGNRTITGGTATLTGNLHYNDLLIRNGAVVTVNGTCRILCNGSFTLRQGSDIRLSDGARLEVYAQGAVTVNNTVNINQVTGNPDNVIIACMTNAGISVEQNTNVWGHLVCANGQVVIGNSTQVFGSVTARSARLYNSGQLTGMGSGFTSSYGGSATMGQQRIHLDRMTALDPARTHFLRIFFANRTNQASPMRLETNMLLVRVAVVPDGPGGD